MGCEGGLELAESNLTSVAGDVAVIRQAVQHWAGTAYIIRRRCGQSPVFSPFVASAMVISPVSSSGINVATGIWVRRRERQDF
jgi:hypothetical protein